MRPRLQGLALLCALGGLATGCSVRGLAVRALGSALAGAGDVFASDEDPELVREAMPFALKTTEALLAEQPRNADLLLAACRSFTQYAYAFVETDAMLLEPEDWRRAQAGYERALKLYSRARDYCLRGLSLEIPGVRAGLERDPSSTASAFGAGARELLYWTAASWGAAISRGLDRPELTVDLPAVRALIERLLELDDSYGDGAAHEVMIVLDAVPETMGGSVVAAREHFARAVELNGGRAGTYVTLASAVAVAEQDWREFRELLEKALAIDPDAEPSHRLQTLISQRRARFLLDRTGDYFFEYEEPASAEP